MVSHELLSQPICHRAEVTQGQVYLMPSSATDQGSLHGFGGCRWYRPPWRRQQLFATWHHQIITITEQSVSRGCMHHCGVIPGCYQPSTYG